MTLPKHVTIFEMGARDGLQNENALIATGDKVRFIDLLSETGLQWIEATSFVSPKAIPQLADATEVFARIRKAPGVRYPVLVPNLERLRARSGCRRRRDRRLHGGLGALHEAQHQHVDRRIARNLWRRREHR